MDADTQDLMRRLGNTAIYLGDYILQIAMIVAVGWFISWFARKRLEPLLARRRVGRNGALLIGRLVSIAAVIGTILSILGVLGASWTGLLTFLSAFTVAIGLSLQDVIRNFFSGILLLLDRPFNVGDRVRVRDFEGEVQGIDVRTTRIRHTDGMLVLVPNSIVFSEILTNKSHFLTRRLEITITAKMDSMDALQTRIHDALRDIEGVRKPLPSPSVKAQTEEGIRMELSLLINSGDNVDQAVIRALIETLDDSTIEVHE